jgi:hypothetical protein
MAEKGKNYVAVARAYAGAAAAGEIPACKWTVKVCRRQLQDVEKAKSGEFPCSLDSEKASRIKRMD